MSIPSDQIINAVASAGLPPRNDEDPSGEFPRKDYYLGYNLNYAATGGKRNELYLGGGADKTSLGIGPTVASRYPYNQVQETVSGHVIEIDDTPGNERILIKHREGGGIDLRADGSVIVTSVNNRIEISGADHTLIVEGEGTLVYKGNLNLKVTGDFNVDVGGNYNVKTAGNRNENIIGSDRKTVNGNVGQIIRGGYSTTVTQQVTDTFLAGHSHNVKGVFSNNVDGSANYVSSGNTVITSEQQMNISSPDTNIAADNLSVFGGAGVIGGENMYLYAYNGFFTKTAYAETMQADTFWGDVKGTAEFAQNADKANTAAFGATAGTIPPLTSTSVDSSTKATPTSTNVREYLAKAAGGIRRVSIDIGNYIKNAIDKSQAYSGVATFSLSTTTARSRLRDPANRSNATFVSSIVSEGAVSTEVYKPVPAGIGRVISGNSTPKFGQVKIGNTVTTPTTDPFLPIAGKASILPDPQYNPLNQSQITSSTKLAPGVRLAKFLGGNGDPVNLDFIRSVEDRKKIAKHLYHHATILTSVMNNKGAFANFRLEVAEGLYKPGPQEKITPGSINDLKLNGRAVVYQLYNLDGKLAVTETFDLAEYWKDTIFFDKLILSYDTYNPSGELHAEIIVTTPELDANWEGVFSRQVETHFNGNVLTQGDLVEVLANFVQPTEQLSSNPLQGETYSGIVSGKVDGLDSRLVSTLEKAAISTGLNPRVVSGVRSSGSNPSGRHAGFAADVEIYRNGKLLSVTTNSDLAFIQQFTREFITNAKTAGLVPSVGVANPNVPDRVSGTIPPLYMRGTAFHYDIAKTPGIGATLSASAGNYWGHDDYKVPAPAWLVSML